LLVFVRTVGLGFGDHDSSSCTVSSLLLVFCMGCFVCTLFGLEMWIWLVLIGFGFGWFCGWFKTKKPNDGS